MARPGTIALGVDYNDRVGPLKRNPLDGSAPVLRINETITSMLSRTDDIDAVTIHADLTLNLPETVVGVSAIYAAVRTGTLITLRLKALKGVEIYLIRTNALGGYRKVTPLIVVDPLET